MPLATRSISPDWQPTRYDPFVRSYRILPSRPRLLGEDGEFLFAPGFDQLVAVVEDLVAKGDELGRFNMGSTVVLLFERERIRWEDALQPQLRVKLGEAIGRII